MENGRKSKSGRVREELLQQIRLGNFPRGTPLPPERKLADLIGVSYMTIRKAVGQLEAEDILERHPGVGTFVRSSIPESRVARLLAVVVPAYASPEHFDFINHACSLAGGSNYLPRVVLYRFQDDRVILDAYEHCDAMIFFCGNIMMMSETIRHRLRDRSRPVVIIGSSAVRSGFDSVVGTFDAAPNAMMERLIGLGHRRIALAAQMIEKREKQMPVNQDIYTSWRRNMLKFFSAGELGSLLIDVKVPLFVHPYAAIYERIMKIGPKLGFTAIVTSTSLVWGVLAALNDLKLRIPDDISVMTVGDRQESEFYRPRLTHYSVPLRDHVVKALEIIRKRRDMPDAPPFREFIQECFVEGETVRKIQIPNGSVSL